MTDFTGHFDNSDVPDYVLNSAYNRGGTVTLEMVKSASTLVDISGATGFLAKWRREEIGHEPLGRRSTVDDRAALTLLLFLARDEKALLLTRMAQLVTHRLTPEASKYLGLRGSGVTYWQNYHRLARAFQRLVTVVDAFPGPRGRRLSPAEFKELERARELNSENLAVKNERLNFLCNLLLNASFNCMSREMRRAWKGNTCIDGTLVKAWGQDGTKKDKKTRECTFVALEYDAFWWGRGGDHSAQGAGGEHIFGFDAHLVTMTKNDADLPDGHSNLVIGIAFDMPGKNTAQNALGVYRMMKNFGYRPGRIASDQLYSPMLKPAEWQEPVQELGHTLVFEQGKKTSGRQGPNHEGALLVDGEWFCPSTPPELLSATYDRRNKGLSETTWRRRLKERRRWVAKEHGKNRPDGSMRISHPTKKNGTPTCDPNRPNAPLFCRQKTLVIPRAEIAKANRFRQEFPHGSPAWEHAFKSPRATIEGFNGFVKDDNNEQLGAPGRRRVRGRTAQFLLVTILIVAANLRKIESFVSKTDEERDAAERKRKSRKETQRQKKASKRSIVSSGSPPNESADSLRLRE